MHVIAALGIAMTGTGQSPSAIGYEIFSHGKAKYHVVTANMNSGRIEARTVHSPRLISVRDLLSSGHRPVAAITGTFFSPQSQRPVADVLVNGTLVAKGSRGSGLGVNYFGDVKIFHESFRKTFDWGEYRFGLRGGVMVVQRGKVQPNPKAQKFKDPRIWGRAARTAVGTTKQGKLVLFATKSKVTLSELGIAMTKRGVVEGISLDGGGSTCLFYKGSLVVPPTRKLSNIFVLSQRDVADFTVATESSAERSPTP